MSKGQFCVYLSKDQSKQLKSFIYESKIFNKTQLDALFDVLPNNYLEIMMSVLQTTYRRPLDINNSIDKSIIKDYIINKYNELNNKESEDDSSIEYYTTGEVVSNEEVESLRDNGAGVFQSFIGNVNSNLISFRRAVFENARKQGIEITDKKDSDFYKFITSLSDSIIRKLMKEGKIITIRPDENLNTNMAVQVNGDVITITYNPLLVVRDADKFDAIISHELLHTVTAAAVNNTQHNISNEEEQQFTQEIFDIIKDLATNENFYWDMNIDISSMRGKYKYIKEFIANVMSNEELREHLSKLKYQQNNNDIAEEEKTSVLTKVFKSIYNYIKSFYSKDTDKELDTTYLEKLTNIIQSHIDTQPSNSFNSSSNYTQGTIKTPIKEEFKGKLIFAQSGTGKSRVADNINVIDGDQILGDILGVDSDFIGITYNQLSNSDKLLFSKEYHKKIESLVKEGKTVLTASTSLLDKADIIIYNESVSQAINRANSSDRLGSNNISLSEYHTNTLNTIQEYLKGNNVPSIKLSENQYLSDVLLSDPSILQPHKKQTQSSITETCEKFLANFGISVNNLQEYDSNLPLFDALNRVVNVTSEEELSEATGYAVAFMMQWSPEIKELVTILHSPDKSVKRAFKRKQGHVKFTISEKDYKILNKTKYLKEIGKDIAAELNKLHSKQEIKVEDNWLKRIWKVISEFLDIMTPQTKEDLRRISSYTSIIAQAINRNQKNLITPISSKPETITETLEDLPSQVQVGEALKENPYEESIIDTLQKEGIYIAGSTSMAVQGSLLRPKENPLHDLDFSAHNKTKEDLDYILNKYYPNNIFIRTIPGEEGKVTYTYLVLDRPFESKRTVEDVAVETLFDKNTGKRLGSWVKSDLVLEEGVKGKFLDFFTGPENFKPITKVINGKKYTFSDAKEALQAKINWQRRKDLWDFNRYIPNKDNYSDQYTEGKVGDASSVKFDWDDKADNNYEVSRKGDKRFSAFNAIFKKGTIIDGVDVGGKSIEDVYQHIIKKSDKNQPPSKDSKLYKPELKTKEEKEDFSYYEGYLPLWQEWAKQNPELIEDLRKKAKGKTLTDKFANTRVSQARALADILNNGYSSKNTSIATKNYTKTTPSDNPNTNFVFTDNAQAYTALHNVEGVEKSQFNSPKKGIKLNVIANNNQAGIRMKDDSTANSNAYGLVVKKNQQDNDGKFIHQEGTFKDTDEDFNMFVALNEHMFNRLEASDNKEVVFPSKIALGRAALPKRFAEWLQKELKTRYGLEYTIVENEQKEKNNSVKYSGYGLKASNSNKDQFSTEKSQSPTRTPSNLSKNYYIKDKNLTITASSSEDYTSRTIDNIEQSDVTIALASDFRLSGEKRTKKEAESRNKYVSESIGEGSNKNAKEIAESIFNQIKKLGIDTSKPVDLNIAGNGIYQKGMPSQEDVDTLVTDILRELQKLGLQIKSVRSGGQTGVDEAGVKASLALGLPTIIHGTKDFKFRKEAAKDISDKIDQYLKRFNVSNKDIKGVIENKVEQSKKTISNKTGLTKEEREKQEKEKQKKEKEAALKSYNTEAPSLHIKIDKSKLDSILINNIPNLAQRAALEKAVYHLFNNYWDFLLQEVRENRETIQDENLAKIYDYILKGSQEEQKLKLLNSLTYVDFVNKNGSLVETKMNPIEYLRNLILKDIINLSMATSQSTKTNSRGEQTKETIVNIDNANAIINYYLVELDQNGNIQYDSNGIPKFKRNTPFGESFYLKYGENNQYLNLDLKAQAVDFIKTLSMQIQPLINEETFDALFVRSQRLLKYNDNIKISFLNKGSFINKSEDSLNEPEEEDRSGLNLVRFKTLEPSKRMSQRVRKILSQTPRYLNNKIQFNSLGLVEYLSPDIAYYQLVDKFAAIKNEQDYNNLINSLQEEYPWFKFIKEKLDEDEIFRNDFYSAFRNIFNRFAIINERGKISYLNGEAAIDILIDDLQSTYESGLLLNEYSIYKSDATPDTFNINNFRNNVLQGLLKGFSSNFSALKKAKEKNTLTNEIPTQIATLLKQLFILSEYRVKQENSNESIPLFDSTISLKAILNTFGVSTDKLDLSHLYTSFEDIIEYINSREEFKNNPINIEDFLNVILNTQNATETDKVKALSEYIADKDGLIEAFIDYFTQPSIESKIKKLSSMLKAMSVIVSSKTGFINVNTNLIQSFYKQYLTILSPLKDTTEIYGTTTFQFGNKPRPSYSAPSYASDILRHLNTIETQEDLDNFRTWVQQEFTQFDFYKDSKGECNHLWIKTLLDFIGPKGKEKPIEDIKEFARNFDYVEILGIGGSGPENTIGKISTSELLNSLIPAAFNVPYSSEQSFGYFRNPLYSDKDVLVLFKAPMFRGKDFKDKVINQLYKVWEAEYDRINFYVTRHKFKNKNNSIEGLEKTGDKFHFFPEFNNEDFFSNIPLDDAEREEYVKENLKQLLENKFETFFATTYSDAKAQQIKDIIEGNSRKDKSEGIQVNFEYEEASLKDDESKESNEEKKEQQQDEVLRSLYEQFYYNDFINYIEIIRLFQGDPALYGNSVALVKRGAQSHVFGQRGYFIDENGNPITERCMYIEDYYADSNSMANVMALLKQDAEIFSDLEKGMIEGLIRKTANYYKDICTTDGQSFRTVDSMKKILKGFGKLTPEIEESLDRIQSGTMNAEDIMKVINNLKPFLYSNESRILKAGGEEQVYERNEKVITQHKNSEYALSALYSILNTALNKSNALKGLQKFMNDNNIDVAHFKSVVKVGANNLFDLNNVYNSKLDEILKTNSGYYTYDEKENKLYLELPLKVSKEENKIKIEFPLEMQEESPAEKYKYIRELLKINIEKDISLSQQELNHKQKVYNAFQRQYGLESLPEDEVVSILNSQLHTDEEGNTSDSIPNANKIHIFKLQDYVLVQPVDDHYLDHEAIFGSQLRNIVPANLPDNFTCTLRIKGKEIQLNKEQTIQLYNTLITDQLLDSYNINLRRKFTSIKEFKKYVDNLIAINDKYGEDIQNALQLDESGTDFRIPFTSPNLANKIDEIILSAAKNAIQRQKIKGGNIVLISNFGFTNDLHVATETIEVTDKNGNKTEQKRIKYIPCYAPMSMMQIYKDYLQEEDDGKGNIWYTIDFEKLKKDGNIDHKFLDMIGYRIPSENNYSIMPIRIVGILPQSMGSSIMLPHDIITMSGTDFKQYWSL